MARKACFEDFYKKISEAFIGDDVSKDYDYLCNMFSYFEEALTSYKSSPLEVFLRKSVLTICSKVTGEHPCRSVISIKLQSNFIEITRWHGCSPLYLLHIFRTPVHKNTSGGLLLILQVQRLWQKFWLYSVVW